MATKEKKPEKQMKVYNSKKKCFELHDKYDKSCAKTKIVPDSETDVNQIFERFTKTGQLPVDMKPKVFADVTPYVGGLMPTLGHIKDAAAVAEKIDAQLQKPKVESTPPEPAKPAPPADKPPEGGASGKQA